MTKVVFSLASASDIDDLLAIENQSFHSPWPREHFESELIQPHAFTLLARLPEVGNQTVGYLIYWFIVDELHILNLAVSPSFRRQGIARRLIGEVFRSARAKNIQTAWLEVRTSNQAALALYQTMGFTLAMTRKRYYSDTGEDAYILTRTI